ncbi:hypothetical protein GCM10023149_51290 [Mucilaginibacter gynuensis]|uniref:HTH luxR-type domain-containing protein n=1 Tax=Mucilaginibacter gynuensis TaxID=1302236 RepID=A0ABP8HKD2_9SPHI
MPPPQQVVLPILQYNINETIAGIAATADSLPGVAIIHLMPSFQILYMSAPGLQHLGTTLDEVKSLTVEEYHSRYFNAADAAQYIPAISKMLERNTDDPITFFQQVRATNDSPWIWHMSSMRILMRNLEDKPLLTITMSFPVDPLQHITTKVSRLLDENNFLRKNSQQFTLLGKREREVLKLLALGQSAGEIGKQLHISSTTVETHRRNIKQKLKVKTPYELAEFARAFDLI